MTKCLRMSWSDEVLQNVLDSFTRAAECDGRRNPLLMSSTLPKSRKDEVLQNSWTASECLGKTMCLTMPWKDEVLQKSWTSSSIQIVLKDEVLQKSWKASECLGKIKSFRISWKDEVIQKSWTDEVRQKSWKASDCLGKIKSFRISWKDEVIQNVLETRSASECLGTRSAFL